MAAIALAVVPLTGCTGEPGSGVPASNTPATSTTPAPDLSHLDVGPFGGDPLTEPANTDESYGRIIEAARLGEAVVNPYDIGKPYAFGHPSLLPTPQDTTGILAGAISPVLTNRGMITGYSVGGADTVDPSNFQPIIGTSKSLRITVLRMPDEAAARAAAQEIDTADAAVSADNVTVALSGYAEARAHWRPQVPTLAATVARGPYVVTLFITDAATDLAAMTAVATATFDAQLSRLGAFTATPAGKLATLAFDTDGMLRRMLPAQTGKWPYPAITNLDRGTTAGYGGLHAATGVVYGPGGADQWTRDVNNTSPDRPVVDRMGVVDDRWLLRLQDPARARQYFDARAAEFGTTDEKIAGPAGVDDAACFRSRDPRFEFYYCQVMDGRYVANVTATDRQSALQMAAAQYALLVKGR
ncbi:hypothetical protein [Nocardia sp. NPDC127526]|uniref:DUF7373 family lipoprotein n=1 Tax=Nocardia sp. NPDC127526 TaxID=3345393 RepID=UPI00362FF08F